MGNCYGNAALHPTRSQLRKFRERSFDATIAGSSTDDYRLAFEERYQIGGMLGEGSDACVYEAVDRETHCRVAVKVTLLNIPEHEEKREGLRRRFHSETSILASLRHRNVVRLLDSYECDERLVMVLECAKGGTLFDVLCESSGLDESHARSIMVTLAEAIRYLHKNDIVHRDLKPENILFRSKDGRINDVVIADFGFATHCANDNSLKEVLGTLEYIAPEILRLQSYGKGADVWALGVILYNLLSGLYPFYHSDRAELCRRIIDGSFSFSDHEVWDSISPNAKDLITKALMVDPSQRICIEDFLQHPWMLCYDEDVIELSL